MKYSVDQLRQVKGVGSKTIERIIEQFDESEYISKYDKSIHIEPNSLINGDMLEIMNGIPDKTIDMILTDLPYGTTANQWDTVIPFEKVWKQYNRVIKDNGAVVLFGSEPFSTRLRKSNIDNYKYDWVWLKERGTGFARSRKQPMRKTENIMVFYKSQPHYDYQGEKYDKPITYALPTVKSDSDSVAGDNRNPDGSRVYVTKTHRTKHNVLEYARKTLGSNHPTEKPLGLIEHLIDTYTKEGQTVLDSTMGSGTTPLGAKNLNRKYIGIELDKEYFEIAKERVDNNVR